MQKQTKEMIALSVIVAVLTFSIMATIHYGSNTFSPVMQDGISFADNVNVYLNGVLVQTVHNSMTTASKPRLNDRVFNSSWTGAVWNYIAIGTGTDTGGNLDNTALVTELSRVLATFWRPAADQWGLNATFTFAGSYTITEAGTFNVASNGNLLFYVGTLSVAVTSSDTLTISWTGTTSGAT